MTGDRVAGANSGELWITLEPEADRDAVAAAATDAARSKGDLDPSIGTFLDGRVDSILPGPGGPLVVSVYGPEPDTLRASARSALDVVSRTDGVSGARLVEAPTEQNIQITVDLAKAEALGMTPGDVRRQAATLVGGLEVGAIFEQQKVFDVQVWTREELRNSTDKVRQLPIDTPSGTQVRLGDVAAIAISEQPTVIDREAVQRRLDIVAYVSGGGVRDAVATNLATMRLPAEYHAEVRDEAAAIADNQRDVLLYAIAAALGVLLLLQAATRNWWTSVAATAAVPLGMVGGLLGALLVGTLTIGALMGLLALAVMGVHNALTVTRLARPHADRAAEPGVVGSPAGAVLPAAALTFLVGLGVALLGDRAGLEAITDLAIVTACGAVTTGIASAVVLPAIASRYGSREEPADDPYHDAAIYEPAAVGSHA